MIFLMHIIIGFVALAALSLAPLHAGPPSSTQAPVPNDSYWAEQWYLENRTAKGNRQGVDMNARAAWALSTGEGIAIAIVDNGVELSHPDLAARARADLHYNFENNNTDGNHQTTAFLHGTTVAGMAAATGNNNRGVIGMAPGATFASWVVIKTNFTLPGLFVTPEKRAEMFRYKNDLVQVQNHSWIHESVRQVEMSALENQAIQDAVTLGRGGKGVVMVHAAGNWRVQGRNANDDAYVADPRSIAVAGVRPQGRAASYSNPGACLLVAAPGGELGYGTMFGVDRQGANGFNQIGFNNDLADYVFGSLGVQGTSFAAPLISGVAALMLAANPNLTYRDVQQILLLSARQTDPDDPGLQRNGAGLLASHNTGFGVPDAAFAVHLANSWKTSTAQRQITKSLTQTQAVPDNGLRALVTNASNLVLEFQCLPSLGVHPDNGTESLPLVHVGVAGAPLATNLTGKAALIQRGGGIDFVVKINHAADAGAAFAIIHNNQGGDAVQIPGGTDYAKIPAVFISQNDGETLRAAIETDPTVRVKLNLAKIAFRFDVPEALSCEQVGVRVQSNHEARGDLRITLVSPRGTRSVLHRLNSDSTPGITNHLFWSAQHFFENSQGPWTLEVSDQFPGGTGSILATELQILGTELAGDADLDGLADAWETANFGSLNQDAGSDPDKDGYSNLLESLLEISPLSAPALLVLEKSETSTGALRLALPANPFTRYDLFESGDLRQPFALRENVPAYYPEWEFFEDASTAPHKFFSVRRKD